MSFQFDELQQVPCEIETPVECNVGTPGVDPRCSDPAFAAANPTLCPDSVRLILKPNKNLICLNNAVQFRAYLVANGGETLLTVGVTFTTNNAGVLIVGALSGNGTGVGAGVATVTVEWQGLFAFAQVTVLGSESCCDDTSVGMVLLIDNSESMKPLMAGYGSKLDFAKFAATLYAADLNTTKDKMAVYSFNESENQRLGLSSNVAVIQGAIASIPSSNASTNIADALESVIAYLNTQAVTQKVIVLFSDGENKQGADPVPIADNFISTGGIIQVIGVRAYGDGFALLNKIASGGMFVNAYDASTGETAIEAARNIKGYFCAGNCTPPGNEGAHVAQLNYANFVNFDVDGVVDLIGGTPPYALYDLVPGNGLYVDLVGSGAPWLGKLTLKDWIAVPAGIYQLRVKLAGNQRIDLSGFVVRITIFDDIGGSVFQDLTIDDWKQDFTDYTLNYTLALAGNIKVSVEQLTRPLGAISYGNLLDLVEITDFNTAAVLFTDNFDAENLQFIPPACGTVQVPEGYEGYGEYVSGYSCYGFGCVSEPVPEQSPDPSPTEDLELD